MSWINYMKKADLFGIDASFRFEDSTKFKTKFGGFLYLMVVSISVTAFFILGSDLWKRSSPEVVYTEALVEEDIINLNDFKILIALKKNFTSFEDESIYNIKAKIGQKISNRIVEKDIPIVDCPGNVFESQNFLNLYSDSNSDLRFNSKNSNFKCLDSNKLKNISFGNDFLWINIYFNRCINSTNYSYCNSNEEIEETLNTSYISLFYIDYIMDATNYEKPLKMYVKDITQRIDTFFRNHINLKITPIHVKTDSGYIFENYLDFNSIIFHNSCPTFSYPKKNGNFLKFSIKAENVKKLIFRRYIKLQALLSNVAILFKILLLFVEWLYFLYAKYFFYKYLSDIHWEDENTLTKRRYSDYKLQNIFNVKDLSDFKGLNQVKNFNELNRLNFTSQATIFKKSDANVQSKKSDNIKWFQILFCYHYLKKNSELGLHFNNFILTVQAKLEIKSYIKFLKDLEKIKDLLLVRSGCNIIDKKAISTSRVSNIKEIINRSSFKKRKENV